ncbi:dihydrofolate reductase family protein [Planobispora takensis]|uniref:Deaminase reductase n=1 Tax=Planobispora takensis TaxID=1367882 RepID=A0A8J3SSZ9_9ACTN|nr:dihydrofolate reductase family protein [Planobispora takensis]GIH98170.1 deaminase reductase [Planobispora takensis]
MISHRPFTSSVFIGTSLDGFIARADGDIDWLTSRGEAAGDTGYHEFMDGIDTVVMGRATYEKVLTFGADDWPYGGRHVAVLSTRLEAGADPRVTVYRDLDELVRGLSARGTERVYADGGQVIQSFLRAGLLDRLTITTVPVLLGTGLPLFGPLGGDVALTHRSTRDLGAGLVQSTYTIDR